MLFKIVSLLLLFLLSSLYNTTSVSSSDLESEKNYVHNDRGSHVDIEKLLDNMDWKEQIGQMIQIDINVLLTTTTDDTTDHDNTTATDDTTPPTTTTPVTFNQTLLNYYIGELGIGSVLNNHYKWTSAQYRTEVIRLQNTAKTYSKNKIPVIWGLDSIHGSNYIVDTVLTPQPINIASSFNLTIAYEAGKLASYDTRKSGITWLFSPLLGLGGWNPFWSRIYETFGEDPILVGDMALSMITGIQEYDPIVKDDKLNPFKMITPSKAAACGKHWIGYSFPHNGHDRSPSYISRRQLYSYFILPWKKVLSSGRGHGHGDHKKLMTIMESYTSFDGGVPNVINRYSLDHILRNEMKFNGAAITDYNEVLNAQNFHHIVSNITDAYYKVLTESSSIDMSMIGANEFDIKSYFESMSKLKEINNSMNNNMFKDRVKESVRRILQLKKDLHMFEESFDLKPLPVVEEEDDDNDDYNSPYLRDSKNNNIKISTKDIQTVLEMTRQSMILTKNENNALPLLQQTIKLEEEQQQQQPKLKVLITGPTSNSLSFQSGGWTGEWQGIDSHKESDWFTYGNTVLEAMKLEEDLFDVTYECGVDYSGNDCNNSENNDDDNSASSFTDDEVEDGQDNKEQYVLNKVKKWIHWGNSNDDNGNGNGNGNDNDDNYNSFDAIIVCLGEENYTEKPGDITDLNLPHGQYSLVKALKEAVRSTTKKDTKIILIYFGGRPRLLDTIVPIVDAVIIGFLPGPLGGNVIADFLTGRINPSGKLPITYPKNQDLSGLPYLHSISDMCTDENDSYDNIPCKVQWPFGHGLSYTQFTYSDITLSTEILYHRWHDDDDDEDFTYTDTVNYDDEILTVTVTVTNSGIVGGSETVLFFTFDEFRDTTPEYKRLRGYQKIWLDPYESKTVSLQLSLIDDDDFEQDATTADNKDSLRFIGPHDDTHLILQNGLQFRVGITSNADCRMDPMSTLCAPNPVTIQTEQDYIGACEAACKLWKTSKCDMAVFPSPTTARCRNACVSIHNNKIENENGNSGSTKQLNNDGWGWTYVLCLESLVWNDQFDSNKDCWKLRSFCRDVLRTPGYDEFGNGGGTTIGSSSSSNRGGGGGSNDTPSKTSLPVIVALISGIIASIVINCTIRRRSGDGTTTSAKTYGDVQFTPVNVNEVC